MCWSFRRYEQPNATIANNDIKVYKVLHSNNSNGEITSPYANKKYDIGKLYSIGDKLCIQSNYFFFWYINIGFHSYSVNVYFEMVDGLHKTLLVKTKDKYSDQLDVIGAYTYSSDFKVFECRIPSGVEYYINDENEIVSESIIIDKDVTDEIVNHIKISTQEYVLEDKK